MSSEQPREKTVNEGGSSSGKDAPVTQRRSWIVRDNDDNPWGPFDNAAVAQAWAKKKWPNVPEYDEENHDGHGCWTVEAVRPPDVP